MSEDNTLSDQSLRDQPSDTRAGAILEIETRKPMATPENKSIQDSEERTALRWRRAILRLSETLLSAADERSDLSPILLEAMHNALENLLVYGEEDDLMALEEWLVEGERNTSTNHD